MQFKGDYAFLSPMYGAYPGQNGIVCLTQEEMLSVCADELKPFFFDERYSTGVQFPTVQHGFLCLRTDNMQDFMRIYNEKNPYNANQIAKSCKARKSWGYFREKALRLLMTEKFIQHPDLREKLLQIEEPIHNDITYNDFFMGRNIYTNKGQDTLGAILRGIRNSYLEKLPFTEQSKYTSTVMDFLSTIQNNTFYVLDTETTGFGIEKSDAIEVSVLRVDGNSFTILDEYDSFINPGYKLPARTAAFNLDNGTGIDDALLRNAPTPDIVARELYAFMGDAPMIMGHNIGYDIPYVNKLFQNHLHIPFVPTAVVDTLKMAREKVEGPHKLERLYHQIPNAPALSFHRSIDDIKATLEIFQWLAKKYEPAKKEMTAPEAACER